MGSSAKKKKEKKKDFQKPKLKVGKAAPKAANSTNTSFKSKSIQINQKINSDAPSTSEQILHHVSLLSSRIESQRKESLAFLSGAIANRNGEESLPVSVQDLLLKGMPLLLDSSSAVRSELLRLLKVLSPRSIGDYGDLLLPYIRAGMTHLSAEIRRAALDALSNISEIAGKELVSASGGWTKTLQCLETILGFKDFKDGDGWSVHKSGFREDAKAVARAMQVAVRFLSAGLEQASDEADSAYHSADDFPLYDLEHHRIPTKPSPYGYLNLFGKPLDDDQRRIEDRDERILQFRERFYEKFVRCLERGKTEGGEVGRSANQMLKIIQVTCTDD